jgi:hypothetical protein
MPNKLINELNFNKKDYDSFDKNPAVIGYVNDVAEYAATLVATTPGPTGAQGVAGNDGPQGPIGPVGPAGLNWQGAWVSGTSYVADDAVGYDGASWFCILATSGTTTPNLATSNWALLASQGAQGLQGLTGLQGPEGPQGPSGSSGIATDGTVTGGPDFSAPGVLSYDFNTISPFFGGTAYVLPNNPSIGKVVTVLSYANNVGASVRSFGGGPFMLGNYNNSYVSTINVKPGETSRFIYIGAGYWKVEYIASANVLFNNFALSGSQYGVEYNIIETVTNTTTSAFSADQLNLFYSATFNPVGLKVICRNIVGGGLMYIKVGATNWVSTPITAVV